MCTMEIVNKCLLLVFPLVLGLNRSVNPVNSHVFPTKADLPLYLRALERIVQSAGTPQNKMDGNFGLGLFIANVNLKNVMLRKNSSIPLALKLQIHRILNKNKVLLSYFKYMRTNKYDNYEYEDTWAERLQKFNTVPDVHLRGFTEEYLIEEYSNWTWYEKRILDFDNSIPNPEQSDACMSFLRWNPAKSGIHPYKCSTPNECLSFVENGSDFGYSLVHRVLFLLVARYSRGCYAFSPQLDAAFIDKMCNSIYEEASYIVMNKFKSPDLLMEQMCTCSLAGHAEFFQRSWLNRLIKQQTPFGCFTTYLNTVYNRVQAGPSAVVCNSHLSGVAAATLSGVVRFIIETLF
ncbi:uncharacterized protein LOC134754135 isoform X2 [Cydia strobilella]|uniref:uncharacterized protein LOC134754135 isoform X2 n=1 Tax=Cydia strobilella TaxID=1100964 RepID=UPI00300527B3